MPESSTDRNAQRTDDTIRARTLIRVVGVMGEVAVAFLLDSRAA